MSDQTPIRLEEVRGEIEKRLDYGDSIAEWVRNACRLRLEMENDRDEELKPETEQSD